MNILPAAPLGTTDQMSPTRAAVPLEQPSLLARAVELLGSSGVDEATLMAELDVPPELFRTMTARGPRLELPATLVDDTSDAPHNVVSLLR